MPEQRSFQLQFPHLQLFQIPFVRRPPRSDASVPARTKTRAYSTLAIGSLRAMPGPPITAALASVWTDIGAPPR